MSLIYQLINTNGFWLDVVLAVGAICWCPREQNWSKAVLPFVTESVYFLSPSDKIIQGEWDTGQLVNILEKLHRPKEIEEVKGKEGNRFLSWHRIPLEKTQMAWHFESSVGFKVNFSIAISLRVLPASSYQPWKSNYGFCISRSPAPKSKNFHSCLLLSPCYLIHKSFWHCRMLHKKPVRKPAASLLGSKLFFF